MTYIIINVAKLKSFWIGKAIIFPICRLWACAYTRRMVCVLIILFISTSLYAYRNILYTLLYSGPQRYATFLTSDTIDALMNSFICKTFRNFSMFGVDWRRSIYIGYTGFIMFISNFSNKCRKGKIFWSCICDSKY